MQITLSGELEQLVIQEVRGGQHADAEAVLKRALELLRTCEEHGIIVHPDGTISQQFGRSEDKPSPDEIVRRFEEFSRGISLGGLKIRDLVEEGRR